MTHSINAFLEKSVTSMKTILFLGLFSAAGYFLMASVGDVRPHIYAFLSVYGVLFSAYVSAVYVVLRKGSGNTQPASQSRELVAILLFAAIFRTLLLFDYPYLTDDIYRYLWDGRVWSNGINPYLFAPSSAALEHLRDSKIHPFINHAGIPTIYAPLLQFVFRLVHEISPTFWFLKTVVSFFDFGVIAMLLVLLKMLALDRRLVVMYAWNPLVVVETAGSGHIDSIGVFFLLVFFYFFSRARLVPAAVALALTTVTKFVALILLPFVLLKFGWKKTVLFGAVVSTTILLTYSPFLGAGLALFEAMRVYTAKWLFNASLFRIVFALVEFFSASENLDTRLLIAKIFVAVVFAAICVKLFVRRLKVGYERQNTAVLHEWFVLFGSMCVLSPTLHPWYLIWLVPVLVFFHNRAWLLLTGLIFLSYQVLQKYYEANIWSESGVVLLLIYLPFYALLLFDFFRQRRVENKFFSTESARFFEGS